MRDLHHPNAEVNRHDFASMFLEANSQVCAIDSFHGESFRSRLIWIVAHFADLTKPANKIASIHSAGHHEAGRSEATGHL